MSPKEGDKKFLASVRKGNSLMIVTGAYLPTGALELSMNRNIDVVFLYCFVAGRQFWTPI